MRQAATPNSAPQQAIISEIQAQANRIYIQSNPYRLRMLNQSYSFASLLYLFSAIALNNFSVWVRHSASNHEQALHVATYCS